MESSLTPTFKQTVSSVGVPLIGRCRQGPYLVADVTRRPDQEPVEGFFDVVSVRQLLELMVLHRVWWISANEAITEKDDRSNDAIDLWR